MPKNTLPPQRAEDRVAMLWFNVTKVVGEVVKIGREDGLDHQLNIDGVVPDDIGMSRIAGKPVTLSLHGFSEFLPSSREDMAHGVTEGVSIGFVTLSRGGVYIGANVHQEAVRSMSEIIHRHLGTKRVWIEAYFASNTIVTKRPRITPNDLRLARDKRAALIRLEAVMWSSDEHNDLP